MRSKPVTLRGADDAHAERLAFWRQRFGDLPDAEYADGLVA
jgi:hypothetical protein